MSARILIDTKVHNSSKPGITVPDDIKALVASFMRHAENGAERLAQATDIRPVALRHLGKGQMGRLTETDLGRVETFFFSRGEAAYTF